MSDDVQAETPVGAVADEIHESEFQRFLDRMDIYVDPNMDDNDRKGFEESQGRVMRAMRSRHLEINDDGEPVYRITAGEHAGEKLTFHEPDGKTLRVMDFKKEGHNEAKIQAVLAAQTKRSVSVFENMKSRDLKVCKAIFILFFA